MWSVLLSVPRPYQSLTPHRFGNITTMQWWDNLYLNEGESLLADPNTTLTRCRRFRLVGKQRLVVDWANADVHLRWAKSSFLVSSTVIIHVLALTSTRQVSYET